MHTLYGRRLGADAGRCFREGWNCPSDIISERCLHQRLRLSLTLPSIAAKSSRPNSDIYDIFSLPHEMMHFPVERSGDISTAFHAGGLFASILRIVDAHEGLIQGGDEEL
jgi:hypothetical protein